MSTPAWKLSGQYYETCSCDFVCPCIPGQLAVDPTKGFCTFAMAFLIGDGKFEDVSLDGLGFIVVGHTPEAMAKGNWSVGLVADDKASAAQCDAITAIASGSVGGPMSALSGLIGKFLGVQSAPIEFHRSGDRWSVRASTFVEMGAQAVRGLNPNSSEPLYLDNTGHPAADRFALARAVNSYVDVLGLKWNDSSGKNNGQFAPFSWRSA